MKTIALAIAAILCGALSAGAADPPPPSIAVTIDGGGMTADWKSYPRLLMAVWPDGRIVWSEDQTKGGPPFRVATVKAASIEANLTRFEKAKVFEKDSFRRSWFGPDSTYHSIWLRRRDKHTRIESWHELFEVNPNLVAVNGGITSLNGRKREDVIASDTKEFQAFRKLWIELRTATSALIPFRNELYRAFNTTGRKLAEVGEVFPVTHQGCPWKVVFHTISTDPLYHTEPLIVRGILMRCFDECIERGDIRSIVTSMLGTGYGDLSIERFLELTTEISNLSQYDGIENITICCDHAPFMDALVTHAEKANLGWKLQSEH